MRWHERVLDGLNLFWRTSRTPTQDEQDLAQAFADIATPALMQSPTADDPDAVAQRLREALQGRVVIERAKGVLAQTDGIEIDVVFAQMVQASDAYARLLSQHAPTAINK